MYSAESFRYMTDEQKQRMSLLGVQANFLKMQALDPPDYPPIPVGLQLAAMYLDFRGGKASMHHVMLFEAGYKNRFMCIKNNKRQEKLMGWHEATRRTANNIRPLITF